MLASFLISTRQQQRQNGDELFIRLNVHVSSMTHKFNRRSLHVTRNTSQVDNRNSAENVQNKTNRAIDKEIKSLSLRFSCGQFGCQSQVVAPLYCTEILRNYKSGWNTTENSFKSTFPAHQPEHVSVHAISARGRPTRLKSKYFYLELLTSCRSGRCKHSLKLRSSKSFTWEIPNHVLHLSARWLSSR